MSQQGASPARQDDDWWGELYDGTTPDTGPARACDSLDDRFASARNAVTERPRPPEPSPPQEPSPPPEPDPTDPPPPGHSVAPADTPDIPDTPDYVGSGPPTYDPEPTALPPADPDALDGLVPDTVLDGARCGPCTLRAVSQRGDSARYRGEPRRDALLTARFGTGEQALVLVAMATGTRAVPGAHLAAAEACRGIARAVGRSHQRLAEDIRAARRGDLKSGLHRLADRALGGLRANGAADAPVAGLRCLLLPAGPDCRIRVFFGVGDGGLFRLRDGAWEDIEPRLTAGDTAPGAPPGDDRTAPDPGARPSREPFRFRAPVARPGDVLVLCTEGLADPLRDAEPLRARLARRWSGGTPPGLAAFLADARVRVKGYADDRTAAAVWEA
ncbi:protein phosphatase 2C domain-containing protein [Streptomyces eurythermus]